MITFFACILVLLGLALVAYVALAVWQLYHYEEDDEWQLLSERSRHRKPGPPRYRGGG